MKTGKSFVDIKNARPGEYEGVIAEIQSGKFCPFCPDYIKQSKYHKNPIDEKEYWLVTNNSYPYKPTKQHILLIHKEHIEDITEISEAAWGELRTIIKDEAKKRNIEGGSFVLRFGNTKYTGASVTHLHAHIIQSDPDSSDYKKEGLFVRVG